ncbi:MAG: CBS domain-containing protein [Gammaproteobacteria bacterium]|nr:CBS domain-containing protein [Gammaproteobacteria bacterium]
MIASLKVRDYMVANKCTFTPDMDILRAIHKMLNFHISGAPVLDNHGNMIGFLSEKDCIQIVLGSSYQQDGAAGRVSEFMSHSVVTVDVDTPIIDVAEQFLQGSHRRFPVVMDNRLVGTIARENILRALAYVADPATSKHKPNKQSTKQKVRI